jgi:cell wall-associated NlpC family hydrolase
MKYQITAPVVDVHGVPDAGAVRGKFETQLVQGEIFIVAEEKNGWCKGTCAHDSYPGYVESAHLTKHVVPATHIVSAARSHLYREASIKSPFVATLGFGSQIKLTGHDNGFAQVNGDAWIFEKHVAPLAALQKDYIATARKFLETPYYWGGRSGFGIDCSGLVQVCLARAGINAARDSGDQETSLGKQADAAQAGDIVFFKGHVGLMADDKNLLHANAFHMKTVIEPLADVVARGNAVTSVRRIS